jgi:heme/copper-type cytochrome/quinol oxidase subunit 2
MMKKKLTVLLVLFTTILFLLGCSNSNNPQPTKNSEIKAEQKIEIVVDRVSNILGCIIVYIDVSNKTDKNIFVSGTDFTLSTEEGSTFTPNNDSLKNFKAITLQPGQRTSGNIEFSMFGAEGPKILNFNNSSGNQQIKINVPSSKL